MYDVSYERGNSGKLGEIKIMLSFIFFLAPRLSRCHFPIHRKVYVNIESKFCTKDVEDERKYFPLYDGASQREGILNLDKNFASTRPK